MFTGLLFQVLLDPTLAIDGERMSAAQGEATRDPSEYSLSLARSTPKPRRIAAKLDAVRAFVARTIRATALLARDARIPKPLRWVAAIGLMPVPGPFDEALLILIAPIFAVLYRTPMRDAWRQAERR